MLTEDMELRVQPAAVTDTRNSPAGLEVLIEWAELPPFEATWESAEVIQEQFPEFHLEDKVNLLGGSIVSNRP